MSLMLRKACAPLLADFNLHEFHAGIDTTTKHLHLYTPCGQHFAIVHGVVFGRLQPTLAEIDYAVILLKEWLTRNDELINEYLDAWIELKSFVEPPEEIKTDTYELRIRNWFNVGTRVEGVKLVYKGITYTFTHDFDLYSVDWEKVLPAADWARLITRPPTSVMNAVYQFVDEHQQYSRLKACVEKIHAKLNVCTVD